jgi:CheY-like chemotaxis protein
VIIGVVSPRILLLEDDPNRCEWFTGWIPDAVWDVTCKTGVAINWLLERSYGLILLDHDLLEEHYLSAIPDDLNTGFAVAQWLAENPECQKAVRILVHSMNFDGANRMVEVLTRSGRAAEHIPFPHLQTHCQAYIGYQPCSPAPFSQRRRRS